MTGLIMMGLTVVIGATAKPIHADSEDHLELSLHHSKEFREATVRGSMNLPFHQTVPLAEGDLYWTRVLNRLCIDGEEVEGYLQPVNNRADKSSTVMGVCVMAFRSSA